MNVSLGRFLETACLGDLQKGMTRDEVQALLGEPDAIGGSERSIRRRRPTVLLYGTIEIYFSDGPANEFTGVFWEPGERGVFYLPTAVITDWAFTPEWTFEQVEDYLNERGLMRDYPEFSWDREDGTQRIHLVNGIHMTFTEGRLGSLYGGG